MSLINSIDYLEIKRIFHNNEIKRKYLEVLSLQNNYVFNNIRTNVAIDNAIIETWNYDVSKRIIRSLFTNSEKYIHNRDSKYRLNELMFQWRELDLGEFGWPFLPIRFDQHVHILNRRDLSEEEKDFIISNEAIKYRRIKDINAQRNDYIEYLIFQSNENVIPTFGNSHGVDFYINGEPYDQKVGKSVGTAFIEEYGNNYRQVAIENPYLVAMNLYKNQDEARFGSENRLLIVYLDDNLNAEDIENSLATVDFNNPLEIQFEYNHSSGETRLYETSCYVILLHR